MILDTEEATSLCILWLTELILVPNLNLVPFLMDQAAWYGLLQTKQFGVHNFLLFWCQFLCTEQPSMGSYGLNGRVFPRQMSCKVCSFTKGKWRQPTLTKGNRRTSLFILRIACKRLLCWKLKWNCHNFAPSRKKEQELLTGRSAWIFQKVSTEQGQECSNWNPTEDKLSFSKFLWFTSSKINSIIFLTLHSSSNKCNTTIKDDILYSGRALNWTHRGNHRRYVRFLYSAFTNWFDNNQHRTLLPTDLTSQPAKNTATRNHA